MKEQIKKLRVRIDGLAELTKELKPCAVLQLKEDTFVPTEANSKEIEKAIKSAIASTNAYSHLSEARFWLGFELGRIRDNK